MERTFGLLVGVVAKEDPDGTPTDALGGFLDDLVEASIAAEYKEATRALAVDWTDVESFARPPAQEGGPTRRSRSQLGTPARQRSGPTPRAVLWLLSRARHHGARRAWVGGARTGAPDGPQQLSRRSRARLRPCPREHGGLGGRPRRRAQRLGLLAPDSGALGPAPARPRGGARHGSASPRPWHARAPTKVPSVGTAPCIAPPPPPASSPSSRWPAGRTQRRSRPTTPAAPSWTVTASPSSTPTTRTDITASCAPPPRASSVVRARPESMALSHGRPEILAPPEHAPLCCVQVSITVPPSVNAKTRQKHPYPSQAHRLSYARRSAAERANATIKDPASNDVAPGWCRLMGLVPMTPDARLRPRRAQPAGAGLVRGPSGRQRATRWPGASHPRRAGAGERRSPTWSAPRPTPRHRAKNVPQSGTRLTAHAHHHESSPLRAARRRDTTACYNQT